MRAIITALGVSAPFALGFLAVIWLLGTQPASGLVHCSMTPDAGWYCR
ncbi:hypothetical protein [Methylobacterium marchantiae]|uniref:Uncharacterized protein n=1 Tax=Methylobacterium marchantiae TaxID=600331 RepID=A0ABW3X3G0_9HYPH|nr:hypothetical protein AIGOOFII_3506 [Methylobacterium marchantiae]